ncbi:MAG: hypothetical protein EPO35_01345, partial [Acidobacteria bacterium]
MGDPSRPADDITLLTSVLALTSGARAKLPADSPASGDLDAIVGTVAELIKRASARSVTPSIPSSIAAGAVGGHETILVVEDNETILTLVTTALSRPWRSARDSRDG